MEKNSTTLDEVKDLVGERTASVCRGIAEDQRSGYHHYQSQAENMRNLILTLATDFRVILVKIAERLYLMRKMEA